MERIDQAWAAFRCSLLEPLLLGRMSDSERGAYFRRLSQREFLLPNGRRKKLSIRTFRRWWQAYRAGGVSRLRAD